MGWPHGGIVRDGMAGSVRDVIVSLINGAAVWIEELTVSALSWALPVAGQIGQATVHVPRSSGGWSRTYIDATGGRSRVSIADPDLGRWDGIVEATEDTPDGGITLQCRELTAALAAEPVSEGTYTGLTAGTLAQEALRRAFGGQSNPPVLPGAFADAPPALITYSFGGRTCLDVLKDLAEQTGQEWRINAGRLDWGPPVGAHYPAYLCDDGDVIITQGVRMDSTELLKAVTARSSTGDSYTAHAPENADRPGAVHKTVTLSGADQTAAALQRLADSTLAFGRVPAVNLGVALRRHRLGSEVTSSTGGTIAGANVLPLWLPTPFTPLIVTAGTDAAPHGANVREGDTLTICLPGAAAGGLVARWRVLTRAWNQANPDLIGLTLQYQRPLLAETLAAYAARPTQPVMQPASRDPLRLLTNLANDVRRIQAAG